MKHEKEKRIKTREKGEEEDKKKRRKRRKRDEEREEWKGSTKYDVCLNRRKRTEETKTHSTDGQVDRQTKGWVDR